MKAMILAAGLGTRLRPITETYAKPSVPFLNIPLLYYSLPLLEKTGRLSGLVFNTHHFPEQIETLAMRLPDHDIAFSHEPQAPLGSGGGIWKARKLLEGGGSFLVANGDEVILPHDPEVMRAFVERHNRSQNLMTIMVMEHPGVGLQFGGVWTDPSGSVRGFGKDANAFGPHVKGYHYVGLLAINDRIFDYLPEGESNIFYDVALRAIQAGERIEAHVSHFTWFETGNAKDFLNGTKEALELFATGEGADASELRSICHRYWASDSTFVEKPEYYGVISAQSQVEKPEALKGFIVLGPEARIDEGARVENAVLLPRAHVTRDNPAVFEIRY